MARISKTESKPLAIVDSNIIIYAMIKDYPDNSQHKKCLALLEKGLKGELEYIITINPIIIVEVYSALSKLLNTEEAEIRTSSLLQSRRFAFLLITKEACQKSVQWAKEKKIPINDALIGASMREHAQVVYTNDEEHFKKLEGYKIKILNPIKTTF